MPTFFRPETDYGRRLVVFQDLVDHLLDYAGGDSTNKGDRVARRAALNAYNDFAKDHQWNFYMLRGRLVTYASQTTGTIAYDHTGGTYERQVTLSDATWPSWAADGTLIISNVAYDILERKSDTVVTLASTANPGSDLAAETTYELYQDSYRLPSDFQEAGEFIMPTNTYELQYVAPQRLIEMQRTRWGPNTPYHYSIMGDPNYHGAMAVVFFPPPNAAYEIDYIYKRYPRPLKIQDYSTGTVTTTASSTTVTGTGTSWADSMVGSVILFNETAAETEYPTGSIGHYPSFAERIITAVNSTTELVVDTAMDDSLSLVKYRISDPVDIDQGAMLTLLLREAERQLRMNRRMEHNSEELRTLEEARHAAWAADARSFRWRSSGPAASYPMRLANLPLEQDS